MENVNYSDKQREIIFQAFNKFVSIAKSPEEFNKRINKITKEADENNFMEYTGVLFLVSEFYDLLPKDVDWEEVMHQYMMGIKQGIEKNISQLPPALFGGLSEVGYSIYNVYKKTGSYERFLNTLNKHVVTQVNFLLDKYEDKIGNMSMLNYDSIYGFAGQGSYLLMFKEEEGVREVLERIIALFIKMTKSIEINGYKVPGWYIPMENLSTEIDKKNYKDGNFNLALSHGISGPLAFMGLALKEGINIDGQKEAMDSILSELLRFSFKDEKGNVYWGGRLSFQEYINGKSDIQKPNRQSWCYGSVGIARAMYIASEALENKEIKDFSSNVLEGIADMNDEEWGLTCAHICHGYAGLLAIMEAMYKDTDNPKYKKAIEKVGSVIINAFDPNSLFGFYNYTTTNKDKNVNIEELKFEFVDDHSFLEGSVGSVLTLMTSLYPSNNSWMRHLLID